jgi:hypothetical protein
MTRNCPVCNKPYSLQPQHVGRRMTCKQCGTALLIEDEGLRRAD